MSNEEEEQYNIDTPGVCLPVYIGSFFLHDSNIPPPMTSRLSVPHSIPLLPANIPRLQIQQHTAALPFLTLDQPADGKDGLALSP